MTAEAKKVGPLIETKEQQEREYATDPRVETFLSVSYGIATKLIQKAHVEGKSTQVMKKTDEKEGA